MDETVIKFQICLVIGFSLVHLNCHSQTVYTDTLKWEPADTSVTHNFYRQEEISEWLDEEYGNVPITDYKSFSQDNKKYAFFSIDVCSGIYCPIIYAFRQKNEYWQLIASSQAKLVMKLEVKFDQNLNKIIFRTKTRSLGYFPNL